MEAKVSASYIHDDEKAVNDFRRKSLRNLDLQFPRHEAWNLRFPTGV